MHGDQKLRRGGYSFDLLTQPGDMLIHGAGRWRMRPNLTLNLGVRYEYTGQPMNLLNDLTTLRESNPSEAFWRHRQT